MRKTIELKKMDRERMAIAASNGSKSGVPSAACPLTGGPSVGVGTDRGNASHSIRKLTDNMEDFLRQC